MQAIPEWAMHLVNPFVMKIMAVSGFTSQPITCGQMQDRYIKLFGQPNPTKEQDHATKKGAFFLDRRFDWVIKPENGYLYQED